MIRIKDYLASASYVIAIVRSFIESVAKRAVYIYVKSFVTEAANIVCTDTCLLNNKRLM